MAKRPRLPITREPTDDGFVYRLDGRRIVSPAEVERIESLAIPPAWRDVEIAKARTARVQARGIDAAGRTQMIYHRTFRARRDRLKFDRMARFATKLPKLRAQVDRDLRRRNLSKERVTACVIRLIDMQLFRVGNPRYVDDRPSYGVTTLTASHLDAASTYVDYNFRGKSGRMHQGRVRDPRAARLIEQLLALSGPEVFQFVDCDDVVHNVRSEHVNAYVKRYMGEEFSAKDFRTWGGTVTVAAKLCSASPDELDTETHRAKVLRDAITSASERLGNTTAVTRSSYIDPRVLEAGERPEILEAVRTRRLRARRYFDIDEQRTLALLEAMR